jgi:hypothetical protein
VAEAATATEKGGQTTKPSDTPEVSSDGYEGLDRRATQTLSQAHLLPDKEVWNKLTPEIRRTMLTSAKSVVSQRTKEFESQRQKERGEVAPAPVAALPSIAGRQAAPTPKTIQDPTPASTGKVDDGRPAPSARVEPGKKIEERLAKFNAAFGDDAKPVGELIAELQADHAAALAERDNKLASFGQRMDQVTALQEQQKVVEQQRLEAHLLQVAETTRAACAKDMPVIGTDDESWAEVQTEASANFDAKYGSGRAIPPGAWAKELQMVFRDKFWSDIHNEAQRKLATSSTRAIRQTPERPDSPAATNRQESGRTLRERYVAAAKAAVAGKDEDEVRREFKR